MTPSKAAQSGWCSRMSSTTRSWMATRHPDARSAGAFLTVPYVTARILPADFSRTAKPVPRREGSMAKTRWTGVFTALIRLEMPECLVKEFVDEVCRRVMHENDRRKSHQAKESEAENAVDDAQAKT